jgi:hypothetical protein
VKRGLSENCTFSSADLKPLDYGIGNDLLSFDPVWANQSLGSGVRCGVAM